MGFVSNIIETIRYIRENGWAEYRKARERYDKHIKAQEGKVSKRDRVDFTKQVKKMQRGK